MELTTKAIIPEVMACLYPSSCTGPNARVFRVYIVSHISMDAMDTRHVHEYEDVICPKPAGVVAVPLQPLSGVIFKPLVVTP